MYKLLLKHFVQVLLIPALGVTLAWYGYIATAIQSEWPLMTWILVAAAVTAILELVVSRFESVVALAVTFGVTGAITVGIPAYFFLVGFPVRVFGVLDHGGLLLGLFVVAVFSAQWRLYRAGHTAVDFIESAGNLPKGSLSQYVEKTDRNSE